MIIIYEQCKLVNINKMISKITKDNFEFYFKYLITVIQYVHYWTGYINNTQGFYRNYFKKFNLISDNLRIINKFDNNIPDKSWMLYLLELFNTEQVPIELNLICQFDDQDYFEAILSGINRYRFTKVIPIIGHTYYRQIKFNKIDLSIEFYLKNLDMQIDEKYIQCLNNNYEMAFQISNCFTGVEWWNRIAYEPYPIRYQIEISNLAYGFNDTDNDPESIIFFPIESVTVNEDSENQINYPIEFINKGTKNGCFYYILQNKN